MKRLRTALNRHPGKRIAFIRDLCRCIIPGINPGSSLRCGRDDGKFLHKVIFLLGCFVSPPAAAQQVTHMDSGDTATAAAMQQLVPAILGTQPDAAPTKTLHVSNGDGSSVAQPTPPTAPTVPSVHMGSGTGSASAGGSLTPDISALIPSLSPQSQDQTDEGGLALTTARRDTSIRDANYDDLRTADTATAVQVIEPVRIRLEDGRIVQLAGIDTADDDPYEPGPVSLAARNFLKGLVENKQVRLHVTKNEALGRMTRLGDVLAQLELSRDGTWVQGALLFSGLARIRPTERNPEMADQMMKLEEAARAARRGLWADPRYAILTPDNAAQEVNRWVIVEGRVFGAAEDRNVTYLNFGPDYRKDFTVGISSAIRRQLDAAHIDPQALAGRTVRVRGWLRSYNGPYLDLANAVWLQVIPESATHVP